MLSLTKVSGAYISTKNAYGDGKPRRGNDFIRGTQTSLNTFKRKVKYKWLNVKAEKSFLTFFVFYGIIYM